MCADSQPSVKLRTASPADVLRIIELERAAATAAHWREQQYAELFNALSTLAERLILIAYEPTDQPTEQEQPSSMLGFLVARRVASEWELENIVVTPSARRMGIGKRLVDALLTAATQSQSESMFLEVRESNLAARRLYEKLEFHETGRRKSYYNDPVEDAVLYRRTLQPASFSH